MFWGEATTSDDATGKGDTGTDPGEHALGDGTLKAAAGAPTESPRVLRRLV